MLLECKLTFEAAHRNTSATASDRARRLHGHSYEITVAIAGPIDPAIGWVMDFAEVKDHAHLVIDRLDHRILNEIAGMCDTTRPDVERWITETIRPTLTGFEYCKVVIRGDDQWSPHVRRIPNDGDVLSFGFEAAHFLPALPETHKCRRIHGHSFRVAVTSVNAGKIAGALNELYERLDHRLLNDLPGLENPTSEMLVEWLRNELEKRKSSFNEIMVAETCTSCCRLKRG